MTPYGSIDQVNIGSGNDFCLITWTNFDFSFVRFCGIRQIHRECSMYSLYYEFENFGIVIHSSECSIATRKFMLWIESAYMH